MNGPKEKGLQTNKNVLQISGGFKFSRHRYRLEKKKKKNLNKYLKLHIMFHDETRLFLSVIYGDDKSSFSLSNLQSSSLIIYLFFELINVSKHFNMF